MNPKLAHILAEIGQLAGMAGAIASFPGVAAVSPYVGVAGGLLAGLATLLKPYAVAAIAAQPALPPLNPPAS